MKSLVFDTGPLISLALNNLLWLVRPLKERFKGEFYITEAVRRECVERPLTSKKFKYEALQLLRLIQEGDIKVYHSEELKDYSLSMLEKANRVFRAQGNDLKIIQYAEMESVSAAKILKSEAVVIDEFITRSMIESPSSVKERMEKKFHMPVSVNEAFLKEFKKEMESVKVIRSFELAVLAYELGLFKNYYLNLPDPKKTLLDGLLWAIKLNGCSVSEIEIQEIMKEQGM